MIDNIKSVVLAVSMVVICSKCNLILWSGNCRYSLAHMEAFLVKRVTCLSKSNPPTNWWLLPRRHKHTSFKGYSNPPTNWWLLPRRHKHTSFKGYKMILWSLISTSMHDIIRQRIKECRQIPIQSVKIRRLTIKIVYMLNDIDQAVI